MMLISHTRHMRFNDRARGTKFYRAGFQFGGLEKFSHRKFRTATEAEDYGVLVRMRLERLQAAAMTQLMAEGQ